MLSIYVPRGNSLERKSVESTEELQLDAKGMREDYQRGLAEFPGNAALRTFLAMTLYNLGAAHDGLGLALTVLAETSGDPDVQRYRPAIEFYAGDLDAVDGR